MPPNADAQIPKLELNDQTVSGDDHNGLQPVIDDASRVAYEDQETTKLQMKLDSLGVYYPSMMPVCPCSKLRRRRVF